MERGTVQIEKYENLPFGGGRGEQMEIEIETLEEMCELMCYNRIPQRRVKKVKNKQAVEIWVWYDRHIRLWTLYPIDEEGNQIAEAVYGANKAEALKIKKELEKEYGIEVDEGEMTIKRLRQMTGLSAQKFGDYYGIPLRTIQNWEYGVRATPPYVLSLLERAVREDFHIS